MTQRKSMPKLRTAQEDASVKASRPGLQLVRRASWGRISLSMVPNPLASAVPPASWLSKHRVNARKTICWASSERVGSPALSSMTDQGSGRAQGEGTVFASTTGPCRRVLASTTVFSLAISALAG